MAANIKAITLLFDGARDTADISMILLQDSRAYLLM